MKIRIIIEEKNIKRVDSTRKTFDKWAKNGKAELMEIEHEDNVIKFLTGISFDKPFSFLDVGCGNGWVVRKIAQEKYCKKSVGLDKSRNMIIQAKKQKRTSKETYVCDDIENWKYAGKFDFIFSMESMYYVNSLESSLKKIFKLLKSNGKFFCGTDFYSDNKATIKWKNLIKIPMHQHSKQEWKNIFKNSGFQIKTRQIKDEKSKRKWKREFGTFFITATKPKRQSSN